MEVFLLASGGSPKKVRFLHARGGVSIISFSVLSIVTFSPRTWRCFLHGGVNRNEINKRGGKLMIGYVNSGYKRVVANRTNIQKYIRNGAKLIKRV